jgi:hypothetical protein
MLILALVLCSCGEEAPPSTDLAGADLSTLPEILCTSATCSAAPCTPGCVFQPTMSGACAAPLQKIETVRAMACPGWCGLQQILVEGCLRYRSEDPACPTWCTAWGDAACWEQTPPADYAQGGAICSAGSSCFGGAELQDADVPCRDMGD